VASVIPYQSVIEEIAAVRRFIYIVAAGCILFAVLLARFSALFLSKRLKWITYAISRIRSGDLSVRIPPARPTDEISEIASNINEMCGDLEISIRQNYQSKLKQKEAELAALQAQISPHFLYNTLESIRMKAIANDDGEAGEMIYLLARLFRRSIKEGPIIKIENERRYSKMYLELFRIRYGDALNIDFSIDGRIMGYNMPNHILQPVLENYIVHGYDPDRNDNQIHIKGYLEGKYITFLIGDNGKGIDESRLTEIKNTLGAPGIAAGGNIGLANIYERLKIIYDEDCVLEISGSEGDGTEVKIQFAAEKGGE
jgi:two-component system sensor histidine kinase YesM